MALSILLSGCVVGPNHCQPQPPLTHPTYIAAPATEVNFCELGSWWHRFSDPTLTELLSTAESQNLELAEAYHRIVESRSQLAMVAGNRRISGGTNSNYSFRKRSPNADPFVGPNGNGFNRFESGLLSSWEPDFFGRIKRTIESANATVEFTEADHDHIRLTLLAEVAGGYFRIRWIQEQIDLVHESLAVQSETIRLLEERSKAGITSELDVAQAKALNHRTRATLPNLQQQLDVEFNCLSVLIGQSPGREIRSLVGRGKLPNLPDMIEVGIPADLLRNRPDVTREEKAVAAASAKVGIATADLYPHFTLTGNISVQAKSPKNMYETAGLAFNVGPSVSWNIFQLPRVFSNIETHKARFNHSLAEYQQTVLNAIKDVENAMAQQVGYSSEAAAMIPAIEFDKRAIELGLQRYLAEKDNFQRVLDSQNQLLQDQQRQLGAHAQSLIQLVTIYKAVGGGWEPVEPTVYVSVPTDEENDFQAPKNENPKKKSPTINPADKGATKALEHVADSSWGTSPIPTSKLELPMQQTAPLAAPPVLYDLWSDE